MSRNVVFFQTESGQSPVEKFLDSLTAKQAQRVIWVLKLIEDLKSVPTQYFRKMSGTEGIWEVRVKAGSNMFRLLGFFDGSKCVVLAHAFQKKTKKTPKHAILLAERRKRDYFRRK